MPTTRFQAEKIVVTATQRGARANAYVIFESSPGPKWGGRGEFRQVKTIRFEGMVAA